MHLVYVFVFLMTQINISTLRLMQEKHKKILSEGVPLVFSVCCFAYILKEGFTQEGEGMGGRKKKYNLQAH